MANAHAADATPAERAGRDFSWKDFVSKKAILGPDLEQRTPQCYDSRLPNPLPTGKCEKQLLLGTQTGL